MADVQKFKIGEKVKIKNKRKIDKEDPRNPRLCGWVGSMYQFCGKIFTIKHISSDFPNLPSPLYNFIEVGWNWHEWMFEKLDKQLEFNFNDQSKT